MCFVTSLMSYPLQHLDAVQDQVFGELTCTSYSLSAILSAGIFFCAVGVQTFCLQTTVGSVYHINPLLEQVQYLK